MESSQGTRTQSACHLSAVLLSSLGGGVRDISVTALCELLIWPNNTTTLGDTRPRLTVFLSCRVKVRTGCLWRSLQRSQSLRDWRSVESHGGCRLDAFSEVVWGILNSLFRMNPGWLLPYFIFSFRIPLFTSLIGSFSIQGILLVPISTHQLASIFQPK